MSSCTEVTPSIRRSLGLAPSRREHPVRYHHRSPPADHSARSGRTPRPDHAARDRPQTSRRQRKCALRALGHRVALRRSPTDPGAVVPPGTFRRRRLARRRASPAATDRTDRAHLVRTARATRIREGWCADRPLPRAPKVSDPGRRPRSGRSCHRPHGRRLDRPLPGRLGRPRTLGPTGGRCSASGFNARGSLPSRITPVDRAPWRGGGAPGRRRTGRCGARRGRHRAQGPARGLRPP